MPRIRPKIMVAQETDLYSLLYMGQWPAVGYLVGYPTQVSSPLATGNIMTAISKMATPVLVGAKDQSVSQEGHKPLFCISLARTLSHGLP